MLFGVGISEEMLIRGGPGNDLIYAGGYTTGETDYGNVMYDDDYDAQIFLYGDDGHDKVYGADIIPY